MCIPLQILSWGYQMVDTGSDSGQYSPHDWREQCPVDQEISFVNTQMNCRRTVFPNVFIEALVYETTAFIILFFITYFWYGHLVKTIEFIVVTFVISVVYYATFHWSFGV